MDLFRRISAFKVEFHNVCQKAQKDPASVQILYATKYLDTKQLISFIDIMRQIDGKKVVIGENRVQDWERKYSYISENHPDLIKFVYPIMIGNLQKNKINKAVNLFQEIHSIDSLEIASALNDRLEIVNRRMRVYLEINISGEKTKHGFSPNEITMVIRELKLLKSLKLKGLMTMAPYTDNLEEIRGIYRMLRELANRYNLKTSMGMSHDWKIAFEQGSDMVRVGSVIFT